MAKTKYDKQFITEPFIDGNAAGHDLAIIKKRLIFDGGQHFPNLNYWFRWNCFTQDFDFREESHAHDFDEIFHFYGGDPMDISDFGAEVELTLEGEKHIITRSTVVYIPKGMHHCPLNITKVKKPIIFINVALTSSYNKSDQAKPKKQIK
jgi:hypothetical protein